MNTASNIQAKRMELKEISNTLRDLKQNGGITTINEGLLSIYNLQGHRVLKTFEQWEKQGKRIKKGAKALYLWGRQTTKTVSEEGHEKEIQYFPLVALFSDIQVYEPQF